MRKLQIGVIGTAGEEEYPKDSVPPRETYQVAEKLGELIAQKRAILVTGGKGGIMEAAAKGAKRKGGTTVGVVKENRTGLANKYIDVEVATGMASGAGLAILVMMSDGIIVLGGGAGTLQELAMAYRSGKPVVAFKNLPGWGQKLAGKYLDARKITKIEAVETPKEAIKVLLKKLKMLS